jgi:hypothetical protein
VVGSKRRVAERMGVRQETGVKEESLKGQVHATRYKGSTTRDWTEESPYVVWRCGGLCAETMEAKQPRNQVLYWHKKSNTRVY